VPEIAPVAGFRDKPAGSAPALTDHTYGCTPPVAARAKLKAEPTAASGAVAGVITSGVRTAMFLGCETCTGVEDESVACRVNGNAPVTVGVPTTLPEAPSIASPPGSAPLVTAQVIGATPPEKGTLALYALPKTASGMGVLPIEGEASTVTLTAAVLDGSATESAVTLAVPALGAVSVALVGVTFESVPPVAVQCTPAPELSFVRIAVNV
jgi:hypothetical protein